MMSDRMLHMLVWLSTLVFLTRGSPSFDGILRNASDGTVEAYMIPPYKSNHASFIQPCPNGDLVMAWFSGTQEGQSDVAIVVSRLLKGSLQWTKANVVSQRKYYSNQNPVLFVDNQTEILYLFHTQQDAKLEGQLSGEDSATIWELQSTDYGLTWTAPKIMFTRHGSFDRNRIVVSLRNTWLYPIYYSGGLRDDSSYMKENVDHDVFGKWLEYYFTESKNLIQPTVIRPAENSTKLIAFFRDTDAHYIYRATSYDDGVTWSKPSKTTLPNNNSGIEASVLLSGHIALVYNPTNGLRNPLVVSVSEDEGLSWRHTRTLEEDKASTGVEFSYPSLFQEPSGKIHLSYTYNRDTIKHKIIPNEDWIGEK